MSGSPAEGIHRDPVLGRIARIQRTAQRWALLRGWILLLLGAVCLLLAGVVLDHTLTLQAAGRKVFFSVFAVGCALGLVAATVVPLVSRLGPLFVARQIESSAPELKHALISYLQCREDSRLPAQVRSLLRRRSYPYVRRVDPRLLARTAQTERIGWALLATVCLFALYAAVSPKSVPVSVRRLLAPAATILPPTSTRIWRVEPGDVWLLRGEGLMVRAAIRGAAPEHAFVVWNGSSFSGRRVLLTQKQQGVWAGELSNVLEDGTYHVVAGDTRSERYRITALPKPAVTGVAARALPPRYTGLAERNFEDGNLEVPADTKVFLTARVNLPPEWGRMELGAGEKIWMEADAEKGELRAEFTVTRSDTYRIVFETQRYPDGSAFQDPSPVTYTIRCSADQAPRVWLAGSPDPMRVEPDAVIPVEYRAEDDFGLESVAMKHNIGQVEGRAVRLPLGEERRASAGRHEWDLAGLHLRPGDVVEYWVEATDNWPRGPHVAESEHRWLRVGREARVAGLAEKAQPPARVHPEKQPAKELPQQRREPTGEQQQATRGPTAEETQPKRNGEAQDDAATAQRVARACRKCKGGRAGSRSGQGSGAGSAGAAGRAGEGRTGTASSGAAAQGVAGETPAAGEGSRDVSGGAPTEGAAGERAVPTSSSAEEEAPENEPGFQGHAAQPGAGAGSRPGGGGPGGATRDALARRDALSAEEIEEILRELREQLEADEVPPQLFAELGMNRKQLEKFLDRYLKALEENEASGAHAQPGAAERPQPRILAPRAGSAADVALASAAPTEVEKDELRSRFEDASGRISARYRDAINAYYKKLSEER